MLALSKLKVCAVKVAEIAEFINDIVKTTLEKEKCKLPAIPPFPIFFFFKRLVFKVC